jgi:hypothetical protein
MPLYIERENGYPSYYHQVTMLLRPAGLNANNLQGSDRGQVKCLSLHNRGDKEYWNARV